MCPDLASVSSQAVKPGQTSWACKLTHQLPYRMLERAAIRQQKEVFCLGWLIQEVNQRAGAPTAR